jgi:hypothetical protein
MLAHSTLVKAVIFNGPGFTDSRFYKKKEWKQVAE